MPEFFDFLLIYIAILVGAAWINRAIVDFAATFREIMREVAKCNVCGMCRHAIAVAESLGPGGEYIEPDRMH